MIETEEKKAGSKGFWKTLLEKRIGFDIEATFKIEKELAKDDFGRLPEMLPELMLRLAYEIRLAKNIEFDPEDESENERNNNRFISLDSKRIFFLLKALSPAMSPGQCRKIVELAVEEDNLSFIKLICTEHKVAGHVEVACKWENEFSGFPTIFELLNYAVDKGARKVAVHLAWQIFSRAHPIILDEERKYLSDRSINNSAKRYLISVNGEVQKELDCKEKVEKFKDLLLQAVEKGYSDIVLIMLGGGFYHSIRIMEPNLSYYSTESFEEAWKVVKKGVVDLIFSINYKNFNIKNYDKTSLEELVESSLHKKVVGSIISELLLSQQHIIDEIIAADGIDHKFKRDFFEFTLENNIFSKLIKDAGSDKEKILQLIGKLNNSNHLSSNVLLRAALKEIIIDKEALEIKKDGIYAILVPCMLLWKKTIENLIRKEEIKIDKKLYNILKYLNVSLDGVQLSDTSAFVASRDTIDNKFKAEIESLYNQKELLQQKDFKIAFSGLSRYILRKCEENDPLLSQAVEKIMQAIKLLSELEQKRGMFYLYTEDVFATFWVINDKITRDGCRKIVELAVEEDNLSFIKYICAEHKVGKSVADACSWKGNFSGFPTIFELLSYAVDKGADKVATYLAWQIFSRAHPIIYDEGEKYLNDRSINNSANLYQISVNGKIQELDWKGKIRKFKDFSLKVIGKEYSDIILIMLGGGAYQFIRVMKSDSGYYSTPFFKEALEIVEKGVVDSILSIKCKNFNLGDYDKEKLKKLVKDKLSKSVVSSIISELLLNQRHIIDKIIAANEKESKLKKGFFELNKSESNALNEVVIVKDLNSSDEKKILQLIDKLNNANHLSNNVLLRKVFKEIIADSKMLKIKEENVGVLLAACMPLWESTIKELVKDVTIDSEKVKDIMNYIKESKKTSLGKLLSCIMKEESKRNALKKLCDAVINLGEDDFRDLKKYEKGCDIVEQAVIRVLTSLLNDESKRKENLRIKIQEVVKNGCMTKKNVPVNLNKNNLLVNVISGLSVHCIDQVVEKKNILPINNSYSLMSTASVFNSTKSSQRDINDKVALLMKTLNQDSYSIANSSHIAVLNEIIKNKESVNVLMELFVDVCKEPIEKAAQKLRENGEINKVNQGVFDYIMNLVGIDCEDISRVEGLAEDYVPRRNLQQGLASQKFLKDHEVAERTEDYNNTRQDQNILRNTDNIPVVELNGNRLPPSKTNSKLSSVNFQGNSSSRYKGIKQFNINFNTEGKMHTVRSRDFTFDWNKECEPGNIIPISFPKEYNSLREKVEIKYKERLLNYILSPQVIFSNPYCIEDGYTDSEAMETSATSYDIGVLEAMGNEEYHLLYYNQGKACLERGDIYNATRSFRKLTLPIEGSQEDNLDEYGLYAYSTLLFQSIRNKLERGEGLTEEDSSEASRVFPLLRDAQHIYPLNKFLLGVLGEYGILGSCGIDEKKHCQSLINEVYKSTNNVT